MLRKIVTIALPVAAAAAAFTFFPARTAQAYSAKCDTAWETCMAQAASLRDRMICNQAFEQCSGGAIPPNAVDPLLGAIRKH